MNKSKFVFSKEDYESGNGFSTYIWGPCLWQFIHIMTFNYPVKPTKEDKKNYSNLFHSI